MDKDTFKIINIKSEILCRSAEDDFFYFNKINSAYKKLNEAVSLTPNHIKSLLLLADISFIKGYIKKALDLYIKIENINNANTKVIASIANCYRALGKYDDALIYCDKAIKMRSPKNYSLYMQIYEMKINILILQKKYKTAYQTWQNAKKIFDNSFLKALSDINYEILNEKINLQKKLQKSNLKIV